MNIKHVKQGTYEYIVDFGTDNRPYISIQGKFYSSGFSSNDNDIIRDASRDEIAWFLNCEEANTYVKKPDSQLLKRGDYIVCLNYISGKNGNANYCYKIFSDQEPGHIGVYYETAAVISLPDHKIRIATTEEAARYERIGKPYDVTEREQVNINSGNWCIKGGNDFCQFITSDSNISGNYDNYYYYPVGIVVDAKSHKKWDYSYSIPKNRTLISFEQLRSMDTVESKPSITEGVATPNTIKVNDIVVVVPCEKAKLKNFSFKEGEIYKVSRVTSEFISGDCYGGSQLPSSVRIATVTEAGAYFSGIKNIKDKYKTSTEILSGNYPITGMPFNSIRHDPFEPYKTEYKKDLAFDKPIILKSNKKKKFKLIVVND